jgi:hypothetical protein
MAKHQAARLESVHHARDGRGVDTDGARQRALVDARRLAHHVQHTVLHRGHTVRRGLLEEDRHRDLVQAADVVTGKIL